MQVERAGSKLKAAARVGTNAASLQLLRTPEIACLATQPSQRELSWPIIVGSSSFLISLTLFTGKGIARLAVNGFILMEKSLGMFAQVGALCGIKRSTTPFQHHAGCVQGCGVSSLYMDAYLWPASTLKPCAACSVFNSSSWCFDA